MYPTVPSTIPAPVPRARSVGAFALSPVVVPQFREPEIDDLREAVRRHHDVLGLQIAMDDARGVRLRQPVGCLRQVPDQRLEVGLLAMDERLERGSAHQLHRDVVQVSRPP